MKKATLLLAFFFFTLAAIAQKGPKIHFAHSENTIDYGNVHKSTDNGVRTIQFSNNGDKPLEILSVQSTAGITILSKPTEQIAVGKSGKIELKYSMTPGPIRKTITLETNATNYPEGRVAVKIKGIVNE